MIDRDLDAKGEWTPPKSRIEERARVLRDLRAGGYCFISDDRTERVSAVVDALKVASWNKPLTWLEIAEVAVSAVTQCAHLQSRVQLLDMRTFRSVTGPCPSPTAQLRPTPTPACRPRPTSGRAAALGASTCRRWSASRPAARRSLAVPRVPQGESVEKVLTTSKVCRDNHYMTRTHAPATCTLPESHAVCDVCGQCCYRVAGYRGGPAIWLHKLSEWEMPKGWEMHSASVSHYVDGVKVVHA